MFNFFFPGGSFHDGSTDGKPLRLKTPDRFKFHLRDFFGNASTKMEREEREKRKLFRYPAAKPPIGTVEWVNAKVRFTAPNGENYEVDLVKMRQRSWADC